MRAFMVVALLALVLGCEARWPRPKSNVNSQIDSLRDAIVMLDQQRVREINAHRAVVRGQCAVPRILAERRCQVPMPEMEKVCIPYEAGELAGDVVAVKFGVEPKP